MIKHPMSNRDAMRSVMARVPAAGVVFVDPALQQFFDDEKLGLCQVQVRRLPPTVVPAAAQHEVWVTYTDPEIEFERRLSV
jgi:hypothetical protein